MSFEITIDLTRVLTETDPGQDFFIYFRDLSGPMKLTRTSFFFITALVTAVEAIIILYNNATGYVPLHGPFEFFVRLAFGVVAGTPVAMILFVLDTAALRYFDRVLPWEQRFVSRMLGEVPVAAFTGAVLGAALTVAVHLIAPYSDGLAKNVINNGLIVGILNVLIMSGLEAYIASQRTVNERRRAEVLERENADIRFAILKTQLNPHFLFNSLNVLSSLIGKDAGRAQHFVDEFSAVYRYILEVIDLPVVELRREMEFARSYLYLQSIRFADGIEVEVDIRSDQLDLYVPPLALQTVIENAFKHNRASADAPLHLRIAGKDGTLTVQNDLQPRTSSVVSTGVGLENLRKRYAHLGTRTPRFTLSQDQFTAELPLLPVE